MGGIGLTQGSVEESPISGFVQPAFQKTPDGVFSLLLFPDAFVEFGYFISWL